MGNKEHTMTIIDTAILHNKAMRNTYSMSAYNDLSDYNLAILESLKLRIKKEYNEQYEKGLEDAWELCRKMFLVDETAMSITELIEIFNCDAGYVDDILRSNTVRTALDKVTAYEKKKAEEEAKRIRIGDVVTVEPCNKPLGVVIAIDEKEKKAKLMYDDLSWRTSEWYLADLVKTGKHVDLEKLFEGIKED